VSAERTGYDDCRRRVSHDRRRRSTRHAVRGAVAGVGAQSLGYLVVYVWKSQEVSEALRGVGFVSQLLGGEAIPAWKGVSWLFLNAHFVATQFPTIAGGTRTANVVTGGDGSALLLALPSDHGERTRRLGRFETLTQLGKPPTLDSRTHSSGG
jgi:hypothetical protein